MSERLTKDSIPSESFMPLIADFQSYLISLASPSDFSGTKLLEIMATFQEPFATHMRSEKSTLMALAQHPRTPIEGSEKEEAVRTAFDTREGNRLVESGITDVLPSFL